MPAAVALEGSIQHTSQERTLGRVTEQNVVVLIRQHCGSQERVQQHTVGQPGWHTSASDHSARVLRAAHSMAAVTTGINLDITGLVHERMADQIADVLVHQNVEQSDFLSPRERAPKSVFACKLCVIYLIYRGNCCEPCCTCPGGGVGVAFLGCVTLAPAVTHALHALQLLAAHSMVAVSTWISPTTFQNFVSQFFSTIRFSHIKEHIPNAKEQHP